MSSIGGRFRNCVSATAARRVLAGLSVPLLAGATLAGATLAGAAGAAGASATPYTVGLIVSATGPAGPTYQNIPAAAKARVALQNAEGGVNGHPIKLVIKDDQTSPALNQTAAEELIAQGVIEIIQDSPVTFAAAKVMQQAGMPVVGSATDGYEWGEQPYTNMFSLIQGSLTDPKEPVYTLPSFFKGVSPVASFGYSISPSSTQSALSFAYAAKKQGLKVGYMDTSVPFGSVNTTTIGLGLKNAHIQGIYMPLDDNTNFAIVTAAKQEGLKLKVADSATGYGQALLNDASAVQAAQGVYFAATGTPVELQTPATKAMVAALAKYGHLTGVPDYGSYEGWMSADLAIKALQVGGKSPTHQSIIKNLRKVTSYNAGGILPAPVNFTQFGKDAKTVCGYYAILKGDKFVVANSGKPLCTTQIPNSDQNPSAP